MISINRVRNTVFFLLDKNNRGFLSPMEFDSFCSLAQNELFENLFYTYNKWLNLRSKHLANTEFADIPKNIEEQIDFFSEYTTTSNFTYSPTDDVWSYNETDIYRTNSLSLVNSQGKKVDIEKVPKGRVWNNMINSKLNGPTLTYPIYTNIGDGYRVFPVAPSGYSVELAYTRTPKTPKWSYTTDSNGNPVFNAGASDRQDVELDESLFFPLIMKIMSFCGLVLQEDQIVAAANNSENVIDQKQS